jgi:capsule polysaccharide export protein KpsC/LpsZ
MTGATVVIINSILAACGSALFAGLCVWIKRIYAQSKAYDFALKALAHDAFFRYCRYLLPSDELAEDEVENLNFLYKAYHSLGLNGTGDKFYNQIIAKPVKVNEQKGSN